VSEPCDPRGVLGDELVLARVVFDVKDQVVLDAALAGHPDDFYLEREAARESIERRTAFNIIHAQLVVKVDFVVRKDTEYRRTEFARRRRVSLEGHPFLIVAPEDLIISKLEWAQDTRSEVQLTDVRNLRHWEVSR
jgi:hypothetical protein